MLNKPLFKAHKICLFLLLLPILALADHHGGSIKVGKEKAQICIACHGVGGNSNNPEWPNLSQQSKKYLIDQLHMFRDGIRKNALMNAQAMNLSDQDIIDLASYYNSLQGKRGKVQAEEKIIRLGEGIYRGGISDRGIPACISCHGPKGLGIDRTGYPKISGQHSVYLLNRLKNYKEGYDDKHLISKNYSIMSSISFKLSNIEMKGLSEYLQGLY